MTYEEMISMYGLLAAWEEFRCGKRGNKDVQNFERHLEDNLFRLHWELVHGTYRHQSYQKFQIFDPKHRVIHKADVRDRIVHHALYRALAPQFEQSFIFDSYSCRVGKGTHAAVLRLEQFARSVGRNGTGPCWALKCDIRKFFDSIDHAVLFRLIRQHVLDPKTFKLLAGVIGSFAHVDNFIERERERVHGIPIGNLTSQLFANVYMNPFDHFVKEVLRAKHYLRYTDDFIFLHPKREELLSLLPRVRSFLKERLALELHPNKIILRKLSQGIDFLGYVVLPKYRILRTKTKSRMFRRIEQGGLSRERLDSYVGLLSHGEGYALEQRLRSIYLQERGPV